MFSTMNTPLLDIRSTQFDGNVNFTGAFTGYRNEQSVQLSADVDTLQHAVDTSATSTESTYSAHHASYDDVETVA